MTLISLLRELVRRTVRDPRGVASQVAFRTRRDPMWVLAKLDEILPSRVRRCLHRGMRASQGRGPAALSVLFLLAALGTGDQDLVTQHLHRRQGRAGARERVWLARLLVHRERPELAIGWLDGCDDAAALAARAMALARTGRWRSAVAALDNAVAAGAGATIRDELTKTRSTVEGMKQDWLPRIPVVESFLARPNRVVHLLNNSLPQKQSGYTVRTHRVALAQRSHGIDPVMLTRPGFPWTTGHFTAATVDVIDGISYHHVRDERASSRGLADLATHSASALAALLQDLKPAALQPTTPHVNAQAALAVREACGTPVVYEMRGFLEETWLSRRGPDGAESDHYRWSRAVEAACAARADHVVTLGIAMRDDLVDRGVPEDRITVVPNAIDVDAVKPAGRGHHMREALGLGNAPVVGYVGSLVPYEGLETLLDAVRLLRDRGMKDVRCLIVGDGPARTYLESTSRLLGLDDVVRFVGRVPHQQVLAFYEALDVFVVPRRDERVCRLVSPLKPVEAMAMARCLVVSALPALEELVHPGVTGATFPAQDSPALAATLEPLLLDPSSRGQLGEAARDWVIQERTWQAVGKRYRDLYASLGLEVSGLPSAP